jgi:PilZ domain
MPRRSHDRFRMRCRVQIAALGKNLRARVLEISGAGVTVEAFSPIPAGAEVSMQSKEVHVLIGGASVRHCTKQGWKYRIGLELKHPFASRF